MAVAAAMAAALPSGYAPPLTTTTYPTPHTQLSPFTLHLRLCPRRAASVTAVAATLREVCAGRVPDHVLQR